LKPHDSAPPSDSLPDTENPDADTDDGGAGRVPFAVADGDFSTPARRRRTITRPRGLRTLEAPAPEPVLDAPATAPVPAAAAQPVDGEAGLSPVDEFLTSPPTPVPEIALTPLPDVEPGTGTQSLAELLAGADLAPREGDYPAVSGNPLAQLTPPPQPRAGGTASGGRYTTRELEQLEIEESEGVVGATPQPEVSAYAAAQLADGNTVTPAPEDIGHLQRDLRAHFTATENAEAELEAAVNAGIPASDAGQAGAPDQGPVPVVENAAAGAEMRLAALGSLPVARDMSPDADQVARDEAIVDDLLRRATEQMLNGAEAPHAELPSGALIEEPEPQSAAAAEITELPLDAAGGVFEAGADEVAEMDAVEATEEPAAEHSSEPSLSPLAQTLATWPRRCTATWERTTGSRSTSSTRRWWENPARRPPASPPPCRPRFLPPFRRPFRRGPPPRPAACPSNRPRTWRRCPRRWRSARGARGVRSPGTKRSSTRITCERCRS